MVKKTFRLILGILRLAMLVFVAMMFVYTMIVIASV